MYGVAKILNISPLQKFGFQSSIEWKVLCEFEISQLQGMIIYSNNLTIDKVSSGAEIPYNVGVQVVAECINRSL